MEREEKEKDTSGHSPAQFPHNSLADRVYRTKAYKAPYG